jgi:hypothetical protein
VRFPHGDMMRYSPKWYDMTMTASKASDLTGSVAANEGMARSDMIWCQGKHSHMHVWVYEDMHIYGYVDMWMQRPWYDMMPPADMIWFLT